MTNIRNDLKLFKRTWYEIVNKEHSPLFCPFAWEGASFMLSGTCGTKKSSFCAAAGSVFELTPQVQGDSVACCEVGFTALFLLLQSWSFLVCQTCRRDSREPFRMWKGLPRGIPAPPGICKGNS